MSPILLVVAACTASLVSAQCACDPAALTINQGTPPVDYTFGAVTLSQSSSGCDLTVRCTGYSPLSIQLYYSSTVDGHNPILDSSNTAVLAFQDATSLDFQYMRCVNGDWIPYMADNDYLALNDPSDPSNWITYNNVMCLEPETGATATAGVPISTTTTIAPPSTRTTTRPVTPPTTMTTAPSQCSCDPTKMITNMGTPIANLTFATITMIPSSNGCDLTVHCTGLAPLSIQLYYSSSIDGSNPILNSSNTAFLAYQGPSEIKPSALDFQYMRCVNGDWIPYMAIYDYLAQNDPSDPMNWITYNNVFCLQPDVSALSSRNIDQVNKHAIETRMVGNKYHSVKESVVKTRGTQDGRIVWH